MKQEIKSLVADAALAGVGVQKEAARSFTPNIKGSVYDPVRKRIHMMRSKNERAYLQSLLGDTGTICITGAISSYSRTLAENWDCTDHPTLDSLGKTLMIAPKLGKAIHIDKQTKLIAFYLNAERPDLSLRLAKALSRQSAFEFNLSQHWFQPPISDTWIGPAALVPLIESLGRASWLIVRRREAVFGQTPA